MSNEPKETKREIPDRVLAEWCTCARGETEVIHMQPGKEPTSTRIGYTYLNPDCILHGPNAERGPF